MQNLGKRVIVTVLCILTAMMFVFGVMPLSNTANAADLSTQAQQLAKQIGEQETKAQAQQEKINDLQKTLNAKNEEITKTQQDIAANKAELDKQQAAFEERVRAMYKTGSAGYIDILLSSGNLSELISNVKMVKKIYSENKNMIDDLNDKQAALEKKQEQLSAEKAELEKQKETLDAEKAELDKQTKALQSKYAQLEKQIAAQSAPAVSTSTGSSSSSGATYSGSTSGGWCWPCSGTITCYFGTQRSYERHPGMDIGVSYGTPIHACQSGVVTLAGWNGGYGNCVMISHGNGIVTLYGHNSRLVVSAGQTVTKGQVIAYAGSTGWSTGPHCHIEFRVNGTRVNPLNYLS